MAKTFDTWHSTRRKIAHAWLRWLLGLEQRRAGYPALDEFLAHEAALPRDEHIARDDAGRFSLARGVLYFLDGQEVDRWLGLVPFEGTTIRLQPRSVSKRENMRYAVDWNIVLRDGPAPCPVSSMEVKSLAP